MKNNTELNEHKNKNEIRHLSLEDHGFRYQMMEEGQAQPHIKRQEPRHEHPKPNQERLGQRKECLGQSEERLKGERLEGRVDRLGPITWFMTKLRM